MVENGEAGSPVSRPSTVDDLLLICRHLNEQSAKYVVIGGFAIFEHGLARLTDDIDSLIDSAPENVARVKRAIECLPDRASRDVMDTDVAEYTVVRVNDEVTVDLMGSAGSLVPAEMVRGPRTGAARVEYVKKFIMVSERKECMWAMWNI